MKALRKPGRLAVLVCLAFALVGAVSGVTFSAFTSKADNTGNVVKAAPDWKGPSVAAGVATTTGALNHFRQGDTVYVYANVTDSGNPASGVASVNASVTVPGYGVMSIPLTAGTYNQRGVTYNYRSAAQPIPNPFPDQTLGVDVVAADNAGNSTTKSFSVYVDNTAPTATNIQTANKAGGQAGKAEQGDTITYTFSEAMDPDSILAGWDGSAQTLTMRLADSSSGDSLQVYGGSVRLGTVNLGNTGYTSSNINFSNSTMTMIGNTVVVTLGTPSGTPGTVGTSGTMVWTPSTYAADLAGNSISSASANESGSADREF